MGMGIGTVIMTAMVIVLMKVVLPYQREYRLHHRLASQQHQDAEIRQRLIHEGGPGWRRSDHTVS